MNAFNALCPLPFYPNTKYQNGNKWYVYDNIWPLVCHNERLLPFQFVVPFVATGISSFKIKNLNGSDARTLSNSPTIIARDTYSVIKQSALSISALTEGRYYLELTVQSSSGANTYYSEVFTVVKDISKYTKLEYGNDDTLYYKDGEINYDDSFKFVLYICASIGKPEYEFEEELTKRAGHRFLESQVSNKVYKLNFDAPEFICDALRLARMSDFITLTYQEQSFSATYFSYSVNWEGQGDVASVDIEFTTDNIIQKLASFNRRLKDSFFNALLVDVNAPLKLDTDSVAQYYKAFIEASGANIINGKLIRELEETKVFNNEGYVVVDLGDGAAKKMSLGLFASNAFDTKNFVTTNTEQEISSLKHFLAGLSIGTNKHKIYESNGVLYIEGDLAVTGGVTQYALGDTKVSTIMDGIACDNITIHINPDTKVLEVIGGAGGGDLDLKAMWAALGANTEEQINKSHLTTALQDYVTIDKLKNFVTTDTEQEITGLKHFLAGLSIGTNKHKLYEKDGVVYFEGDLAVTGGITQYALGDTSVSTIMDGINVDGITISKEGGILKVIGGTGGGSDFDSTKMWELLSAATNEQINKSHLTTALSGYILASEYTAANILAKLKTVDGSSSELDADLLDGTHKADLFTAMNSSRATNLSVTVGGTTKTISSLHADYAYELGSPVTIWGQTFRGNNNISGNITVGGNIINMNELTNSLGTYIRLPDDGSLILSSNGGTGNIAIRTGGTRGTECIFVQRSTNNVGIGTVTPSKKLHVLGEGLFSNKITVGQGIDLIFGSNYEFIRLGWTSDKGDYVTFKIPGNNDKSKYFEMRSFGTFFVSGNILATGGITQYSDKRAKTVINNIDIVLKDIANSPAIRFKWNGWKQKDDGKIHAGGIAQYIKDIIPEVITNSDGALTMDYGLTGYLFAVNIAKHLVKTNSEVEKLKKRIEYLEQRLKLN